MQANTKQMLGLFGIATLILILLWLNQRRIAVANGEIAPLVTGQILPPEFNIWQYNPNPLAFSINLPPLQVNELYYAKSICQCQE